MSSPRPLARQVVKFGGTSVQSADALGRVLAVVQSLAGAAAPPRLVVVLSAMGGVTDLLIDAATRAAKGDDHAPLAKLFSERHEAAVQTLLPAGPRRDAALAVVREATSELTLICQSLAVLKERTPRTMDLVVARGERTLARIFQLVLEDRGLASIYVDAPEILRVKKQYGSFFPDLAETSRLAGARLAAPLDEGRIVVVPGFIGSGPDGTLLTLGRGGSDLTATVLAHALSAESVTLYKEVDGLLTADPRYVAEARIVPELHYREAAELAYYGAKVLHPRTIIPLLERKIPLHVRNTFKPDEPGTRIAGDVPPGAFPVKALTASMGQALVAIEGKGMMGIPGIAGRAFQALAQAGISVSVISQASSEANLCLVVPDAEAASARAVLEDAFQLEIASLLIDGVRVTPGQAVLAVVGLGMKGTPGIAGRTFGALARAEANVEAIAQGSSELNISVVVSQDRAAAALASLHREFRLEKLHVLPPARTGHVHWTLYGAGQIGRALLRQVLEQDPYFREKMGLTLHCVGVADSAGLHLQEQGLGRRELEDLIARKEGGAPLSESRTTLARLWQVPVAKGIFVDATASDSAPLLLEAMKAGWSVALANKKPLAVPQERFDELFETARRAGVHLRYEATVGAGLPILDTLAKLADAGDEVRKIAGAFSGTLGYLMTQLEAGVPFSEAVATAQALGYTEPHPRDDLSGMDVARKALILARTLGLRADLADIAVEALFPPTLDTDDPKAFVAGLSSLDAAWKERLEAARRDGKALRYVASIEKNGASGIIKVGVEAVPRESPLGRLVGTDNQVTLTTRRYDKNPLVVSGPGAGADVTAAGVLNDVLAIATAGERTR